MRPRILVLACTSLFAGGCSSLLLPYHEDHLCTRGATAGFCGSISEVYKDMEENPEKFKIAEKAGRPSPVYEHPKVMKFEVPFYAGRTEYGDYHLRGGIDFRVGYPFLAGAFYLREGEREGGGLRLKSRIPLFGRLKLDLSLGGVYLGGTPSMAGEVEAVYFTGGSFSLRLSGSFFEKQEVKGWRFSAGFGF